jgi:hypothetical protein
MAAEAEPADAGAWLTHCEGFEVDGPGGRIGWVEEVERDAGGAPCALLVRRRPFATGLLRLWVEDVVDVWPAHGRVLARGVVDGPGRLREYRCAACGYGAAAPVAPKRCPMCGGGAWELVR